MPKISVILPVYNVERWLSRCLDSLLKQTFSDFELICVNDGSTDSSRRILAEYAAKDSRLRIIDQENRGLPAARNTGLASATGEYVYFLDSDDAIHPQLFEIALFYAQQQQADIVCFQTERSDGLSYNPEPLDPKTITFSLSDNPLYLCRKHKKIRISYNVWTKFYKRSLIGENPFIEGIVHEDYPFVWTLMARKPHTVLLDAVLHYYTINPQSILHQKIKLSSLTSFAVGVTAVCEVYQHAEPKARSFVIQTLVPNILKHSLRLVSKAPKELKADMRHTFIGLLSKLADMHCLGWRGYRLWHRLYYAYLLTFKK
jgi:glycosyltransferase involved in cell wall biosynthesis